MKKRIIQAASNDWFNNMQANSTYKKLQKACNLHGYVLGNALIHVNSDKSIEMEVVIRADKNSRIWGEYLPHIKVTDNGTTAPDIKILTFDKVTLDEDAFGLYALAVQHANHLLKLLLEEINWSTLYKHEVQ